MRTAHSKPKSKSKQKNVVSIASANPDPQEGETPAPADEDSHAARPGEALKKLKRAVGKKVLEQSDKIAESLVKATIEGNSNSARIVVGLVDKRRKSTAQQKKLKKAVEEVESTHSVAMDLAEGPDWDDDDDGHPIDKSGKANSGNTESDAMLSGFEDLTQQTEDPTSPTEESIPPTKETHHEAED